MKKYLFILFLALLLPFQAYAVTAQMLIVAGGGAGGAIFTNNGGNCASGGGGAGGLIYHAATTTVAGTYTITVGGGAGTTTTTSVGANGTNSSVSGFSVSTGGGGGSEDAGGSGTSGNNGGSGGGGQRVGHVAGTGISGQGHDGALGGCAGGGGGGAQDPGHDTGVGDGGTGGNGSSLSITGASTTYAGGGGSGSTNVKAGGFGGGGRGGTPSGDTSSLVEPSGGTNGTGGGGGGGGTRNGSPFGTNGGQGGSGIVIISYVTADFASTTYTFATQTIDGANTILTWKESGTWTVPEFPGGGGGSAVATTTLQDLNYTYDAVGNITSIFDLSGTNGYAKTYYTYDNLYRLTSASTTNATTTNWMQTYAYNDLGNITSKSDVGSYTYAGTGWANPHAPTTINGTTYSYDKAGNLTSAGAAAYTWNYRNRLTDTNINSTTTHYLYNFDDQRVQQDVKIGAAATSTTRYFSKLFETKGATTTLYVFLPNGELLATVEGNGSATSTYIAHTDHQGSTNVMSDKNGRLAQLATYYPFGAKRNNELPSNGFQEKRGFIGQYEDAVVQLSYLNARYYDATRGQFLSEDPMMKRMGLEIKELERLLLDPQMQNYYSYAKNNPINLSDPSGEGVRETIANIQQQIALLTQILQLTQQLNALSSTPQPTKSLINQSVNGALMATNGASWVVNEAATVVNPNASALERGVAASTFMPFGALRKVGGTLAKEALEQSVEWALRTEKLKHVFDNAKHGLDPLVKKLGGEPEVIQKVLSSLNGRFSDTITKASVEIEGFSVTVRGAMDDGIFKIGTMFIPK